jgi:hypothetical protein
MAPFVLGRLHLPKHLADARVRGVELWKCLAALCCIDTLQGSSSSRQFDLVFLHCDYWSCTCTQLRPRKYLASLFNFCSRVHWHVLFCKSTRTRQVLDILGILHHPHLRTFSSLLIYSSQIYWYLIRSSRASLVIKFPITSVFFLK